MKLKIAALPNLFLIFMELMISCFVFNTFIKVVYNLCGCVAIYSVSFYKLSFSITLITNSLPFQPCTHIICHRVHVMEMFSRSLVQSATALCASTSSLYHKNTIRSRKSDQHFCHVTIRIFLQPAARHHTAPKHST